jgi:diguanylate cyclase (GGDEF)-like protein
MMSGSKAKILVVDDDRYSLDLLGDILKSEGYYVEKASSGREAMAASITTNGKPDLILLDIMMPGMSGYDVTKSLKDNELTRDIPVIMVTVLDQPHHKVNGFSIGAEDYITKPFDASELVARVKSALRAKFLQDELRNKNLELGRVNEILRSLNVTAGGIEQAEKPEDVFKAASDELGKLGFQVIINLLDEKGKNLIVNHLSFPQEVLKEIEEATGSRVVGFEFPLEAARVYKKAVKERKALFVAEDESVLEEMFPLAKVDRSFKLPETLRSIKGIFAPIYSKRLIGTMVATSKVLTEKDIPAVTAFADQVGVAIENSQLYHEVRARAERVEVINEIIRSVNSSLDLSQVLKAVSRGVRKLIDFDRASLAILDDTGKNLQMYALTRTRPAKKAKEIRLPSRTSLGDWTMKHRRAHLFRGIVKKDVFRELKTFFEEGMKSSISVPLLFKGRLVATFNLGSRIKDAYTDADLDLLEQIGDQIAAAIENAKLFADAKTFNRKLKKLSLTDGLTKLNNYRHFRERLESEFLRSVRYNMPLSCIMVDTDNFKVINDRFGHQQGDAVLRGIAKVLKSSVRKIDFVARYAGDEFAIILPSTKLRDALSVAEKLLDNLTERRLPGYKGDIPVTLSLGVAAIPHPEIKDTTELIKKADRALYKAKREGKNRVGVDEEAR